MKAATVTAGITTTTDAVLMVWAWIKRLKEKMDSSWAREMEYQKTHMEDEAW